MSRGGKRHELNSCDYATFPWLIPKYFASFDANSQVPDLITLDILYPGIEDLILCEKGHGEHPQISNPG